MTVKLLKYYIKRLFVRPRFLFLYMFGNYAGLLAYCRRLSLFSKCLDQKVFLGSYIEKMILKSAEKIIEKNPVDYKVIPDINMTANAKVALIATTISESGGHTECILRFVDTFRNEFSLALFLNNSYGDSSCAAPTKFEYLNTRIPVYNPRYVDPSSSLVDLFTQVQKFNPDVILVYSHMLDSISVGLMGLVKKYGRAKIIFYNHGDHLISLGKCFADLVIEARRVGQFITQHYSACMKTCIIPFQIKEKYRPDLTDGDILSERKKLFIGTNDVVSLSGFSSHKVLRDQSLSYFNLLKKLLIAVPNYRHILISNFTTAEMERIRAFFADAPGTIDRIIFLGFVSDFEKYVQICDFFIDSFPLGSALTHVDVIRYKKPTVIKKNIDAPVFSFEDYLYDDYGLIFSEFDEMYQKILHLINDKEERIDYGNIVYEHFKKTYDPKAVADRYRDLIYNRELLQQFCRPLGDSVSFHFKREVLLQLLHAE